MTKRLPPSASDTPNHCPRSSSHVCAEDLEMLDIEVAVVSVVGAEVGVVDVAGVVWSLSQSSQHLTAHGAPL